MSSGRTIPTNEQSIGVFWSKVAVSGQNDCWIWNGPTNKPRKQSDYVRGIFCYKGMTTKAHLFSALLAHGPRPADKETLHSCDNALCVNPKHLSYGLHKDNVRQCTDRKRNKLIEITAGKTHCIRGHILGGDNLYTAPSGLRVCRECIRIRKQLHKSGITKAKAPKQWPHGKWL